MPFILSDTKDNIYNSINDNDTVRNLFGNPIIMSLIIIVLILCIFTIQIYNTDFDDITFIKQSKVIIYTYIVVLISVIINNSIILHDCKKLIKTDKNNLYTNLEQPSDLNIISSNKIGNSELNIDSIYNLDLPSVGKLDVQQFLN
jgi:hypothetical protein